jgi:hypothetical protein
MAKNYGKKTAEIIRQEIQAMNKNRRAAGLPTNTAIAAIICGYPITTAQEKLYRNGIHRY